MSCLISHAQTELEKAGYFKEDSIYDGELGKDVLELIKCFSDQDHSGLSAGLARNLFYKLSNYEPLTELTMDEEEWFDCFSNEGIIHQQNKRCPSVFREKDSNIAICSEVYHFKQKDGTTFTTSLCSSKKFNLPGMPPKKITIEEGTLEHKQFIKDHQIDPFNL